MDRKRIGRYVIAAFLMVLVAVAPVTAATAKLSKSKLTLYVGETYKLKAKGFSATVKWSSGNKAVAKVSSTGKVTAKKAGTASILAKAGGKKAKCKVTVKNTMLTAVKKTMKVGDTFSLSLKSAVPYDVTWRSTKPSVAAIVSAHKGGVTIQAMGNGKAKIVVTYGNQKYACTIKVGVTSVAPAEDLIIAPPEYKS